MGTLRQGRAAQLCLFDVATMRVPNVLEIPEPVADPNPFFNQPGAKPKLSSKLLAGEARLLSQTVRSAKMRVMPVMHT